jgi:urea transport system ATP-binding protein
VIRGLARSGDMAILLIEQYYDFARSLADHYMVMSRGEIVKQGRGSEMDAHDVRSALAV